MTPTGAALLGKGDNDMNIHFAPNTQAPCDDTDLRADLARKIQERDLALQRRDVIASAAERSEALIATIKGEMEKFDDIDARIAGARAQTIKDALTRGDDMPTLAIPPALQKLAAQKLNDENRLTAANSAREALLSELEEANNTLSMHQANVTTAAEAVAAVHAEKLGAELAQMENDAADMRLVLMGYCAIMPGNRRRPASARLLSLMREPPANANIRSHAGENVARWAKWTTALCNDAASQARDMVS